MECLEWRPAVFEGLQQGDHVYSVTFVTDFPASDHFSWWHYSWEFRVARVGRLDWIGRNASGRGVGRWYHLAHGVAAQAMGTTR